MEDQAGKDFSLFSAPDPKVVAEEKKEKEKAAKTRAAASKLKPEQTKAAQQLSENLRADVEALEKMRLIDRLNDYMKLFKEYYSDRVEFLKVPKKYGANNSVDELRVWVKECESELGKKNGLDYVKLGWVEGFKLFETINKNRKFGLDVRGIGGAAAYSIADQEPDEENGKPVPGPAVPTLAEFSIKYGHWFSSSVEVRMALMAINMIMGVHRANTNADINVQKAATTGVSQQTADLMNQL